LKKALGSFTHFDALLLFCNDLPTIKKAKNINLRPLWACLVRIEKFTRIAYLIVCGRFRTVVSQTSASTALN
jgi:hypothetical protein